MIKQWVRQSVMRMLQPVIDDVGNQLRKQAALVQHSKMQDEIGAVDKNVQLLLSMKYKELLQNKQPLPSMEEVQFRAFSQTSEDGLLLYVFSLIGTTNKKCVEICAGNGIESNTANLIINHGWHGLLFDGDEKNVEIGRQFYARCRDTFAWPPKFVHGWITTESVNPLIRDNGVEGDIDLLSIDIDGNDYWIWDAVDCVSPRVVMLEYENAWGAERSVTLKYQEDYVWRNTVPVLPACGASLPAFAKLGKKKGYRLVSCNRLCFNAVFMKEGVGEEIFPEIPVEQCFDHPLPQYRIQYRNDHEQKMQETGPWVDV